MFAETNTTYSWTPLVADAGLGLVAVVVIIPFSLFLGGFSFFLPWMIVIPVMLFAAGYMRGASSGSAWLKAIALSAATFLVSIALGRPKATIGILTLAFTILPAIAGTLLRRRRMKLGTDS